MDEAECLKGITWRCFHCNDVFTDWGHARNHFGWTPEDGPPVCMTERSTDSTVYHLKRRLEIYQREDTDLHRQIASMEADHRAALIREEEKGYARGLKDAQYSVLIRHAAELLVAAQLDDSDYANCSFRSLPDQLQSEIEKLAEHITRDRTTAIPDASFEPQEQVHVSRETIQKAIAEMGSRSAQGANQ